VSCQLPEIEQATLVVHSHLRLHQDEKKIALDTTRLEYAAKFLVFADFAFLDVSDYRGPLVKSLWFSRKGN